MTALASSATLDLPRDEILARIRSGILSGRSDVAGIIVIGSFARGEPWHDIDVVVVLEALESGTRVWVDTAVTLSGLVMLDARVEILLYSKRGFLRGLRNHSPFLLDVAMDGIVVYDGENLTEALAETRQYIQERGIRRTYPGGLAVPCPVPSEHAPIRTRERGLCAPLARRCGEGCRIRRSPAGKGIPRPKRVPLPAKR